MKEEFLQYAWKYQLIETKNLQTTSGETLQVINPGRWNSDSGPDFFNASVKINGTTWVGNIEIHKKSSDWKKHGHNCDNAYNNVVLHVVVDDDLEIRTSNGIKPATVEIKVLENVVRNFENLITQKDSPPCSSSIKNVNPIYVQATLDSMLVERLHNKTKIIESTLKENYNDWNQTFYQHLAINFGFKVNALPFEMVTRSLPLKTISHHSGDLLQVEALLFGQSGLLNEQLLGDDYYLKLRDEYSYLARKYKLKGIESHLWKFMRLRPANFPTLRIAQFAQLVHNSKALFSKILETDDLKKLIGLFNVTASKYWDSHYRFNVPSKLRSKKLGLVSQHNVLINTVVPFLYLYGERNNKPFLKNRAFELLEAMPPEKNSVVSLWSELGIKSSNACDSQALIQLKNVYCQNKKCLNCQIGNKVINQ